jgi:diguanylate cyclase (GGDEF)-like protein
LTIEKVMSHAESAAAESSPSPAALRKVRRQSDVAAMQRLVVASWLIDAVQLASMAAWAGVDCWGAFWSIALGGGAICAGFGLAFARGWNRHARDPSLTVPHLAIWSVVILATAAVSPEATMLVLSAVFLVFGFAALRLTPTQMLPCWVAVSIGIALVVMTAGAPITLPTATPLQAGLSVLWITTLLGRCALLGLYGARARLRLGQRTRELADATARLEQLAMHDPLTGVLNRGAINLALASALDNVERGDRAVSIVMIDLDHFKRINDGFGHGVGDEVLRRFVGIVAGLTRSDDRIGRYGGEEFLLLLPQTAVPEESAQVADRLLSRVLAYPWEDIAPGLAVSASFGVATARPGDSLAGLVGRADDQLYRAKREGRGRVCAEDAPAVMVEAAPMRRGVSNALIDALGGQQT